MLASVSIGARGSRRVRELASGLRRRRPRRPHLFINAFVYEFGALIEVVASAALFGTHPAFPRRPRARHRLRVLSRFPWAWDMGCCGIGVRSARRNGRARAVGSRRTNAVSFATREHECAGNDRDQAWGGESDTKHYRLHRGIPDIRNWRMEEAAGYLPENIRLRNAFNNSPSQLRGERELSRARQR